MENFLAAKIIQKLFRVEDILKSEIVSGVNLAVTQNDLEVARNYFLPSIDHPQLGESLFFCSYACKLYFVDMLGVKHRRTASRQTIMN